MLAVILAGGMGMRLAPVTNHLPKALVPINGIPIIQLQLNQLERIGVNRVIILTGHLSYSIENYLKFSGHSLDITCVATEPDFSTAERLLQSANLIGNSFVLMYCDNYITSDQDLKSILSSQHDLTFLIESRSKGNVRVDSHSRAHYVSDSRFESHNFVELGNIVIHTEKFWEILRINRDLPKTLEQLSEMKFCSYQIVSSPVISVSSFERYLELTANRKVIFLDRDGILLKKMPHRQYLTEFSKYEPIYDTWEVLKKIAKLGVDYIIVTNQPGVATGEVDEIFLQELHLKLVSDLINYGINILAIYVCKHHWDDNCACRKPKPGMLKEALEHFRLDHRHTLYIGDEITDAIAASSSGIGHILVNKNNIHERSFETLADALPTLLAMIGKVD